MNEIKNNCKHIMTTVLVWLSLYLGYSEPDISIFRGIFNCWLLILLGIAVILWRMRDVIFLKGLKITKPTVTAQFAKETSWLSWRSILGYISFGITTNILFSTDHLKTGIVYVILYFSVMVSGRLTRSVLLKFSKELSNESAVQ